MCLGRNAIGSLFWIWSPAGRWGGRGLRTHTAGPVWESVGWTWQAPDFVYRLHLGFRRASGGAIWVPIPPVETSGEKGGGLSGWFLSGSLTFEPFHPHPQCAYSVQYLTQRGLQLGR